ncbi:MAG: DUF2029 domain-containing protein [Deltaproteobacteria bacterium]|nr:DUF2029 domain-containing protein [Deltaproteobacteria bacterium]
MGRVARFFRGAIAYESVSASILRLLLAAVPFGLKMAHWEWPDGHPPPDVGASCALASALFVVVACTYAVLGRAALGDRFEAWLHRASVGSLLVGVAALSPTEESAVKLWWLAISVHAALVYLAWPLLSRVPGVLRRLNPAQLRQCRNLFFIGLFLKLALSPLMRHDDVFTMLDMIHWGYEQPFNVYGHSPRYTAGAKEGVCADYYPLAMSYSGVVHALYAPAFADLEPQPAQGGAAEHRHIFFMRLGYLWFDLATAILLLAMFAEPRRALWAFALWWLNPVAVYVTYVFGQFDIIIGFMVLLCVWLEERRSYALSAACLGIGALFKLMPIAALPLACLDRKSWRERAVVVGAGLGVFLAVLWPFLHSRDFVQYVIFGTMSQKAFESPLLLGGGRPVYLFAVGMILYAFYLFARRQSVGALQITTLTGAILMVGIPTNPQWLLWFLPVFCVAMVRTGTVKVAWLLFASFFLSAASMVSHLFPFNITSTFLADAAYFGYVLEKIVGISVGSAVGARLLEVSTVVIAYQLIRGAVGQASVDLPSWLVPAGRALAIAVVVVLAGGLWWEIAPTRSQASVSATHITTADPTEAAFIVRFEKPVEVRGLTIPRFPLPLNPDILTVGRMNQRGGVYVQVGANEFSARRTTARYYFPRPIKIPAGEALRVAYSMWDNLDPALSNLDLTLTFDEPEKAPVFDRLRAHLSEDRGFAILYLVVLTIGLLLAFGAWRPRAGGALTSQDGG